MRAADRYVAQNRRARHDYLIEDTIEAGLVLHGTEVKVLRQGQASITEAYADQSGGELFLVNANIPEYASSAHFNHQPRRSRKLLLHRKQMNRLLGRFSATGLRLFRYLSTSTKAAGPKSNSVSPEGNGRPTSVKPQNSAIGNGAGHASCASGTFEIPAHRQAPVISRALPPQHQRLSCFFLEKRPHRSFLGARGHEASTGASLAEDVLAAMKQRATMLIMGSACPHPARPRRGGERSAGFLPDRPGDHRRSCRGVLRGIERAGKGGEHRFEHGDCKLSRVGVVS